MSRRRSTFHMGAAALRTPGRGLRVALAILCAASVLVVATPRAKADLLSDLADAPSGLVVNSPKGFIGCVSEYRAQHMYCFVTQVLSRGAEAGQLTLTSWVCNEPGRQDLTSSVPLRRSALRVSGDGSFIFVANHVPGMGRVVVKGTGEGVHEPAVAQGDPMFFWPQGFRLVSPTLGLTLYVLDDNTIPGPHLTTASVGGVSQAYLFGVVWASSTSGEWDAKLCYS